MQALAQPQRFATCVNNDGYPVSLEFGKLYRVLSDADAAEDHMIRVIDESGEDNLYDAARFVLARLSDTD